MDYQLEHAKETNVTLSGRSMQAIPERVPRGAHEPNIAETGLRQRRDQKEETSLVQDSEGTRPRQIEADAHNHEERADESSQCRIPYCLFGRDNVHSKNLPRH